jgi:ankyrin repeat protein
MKARLLTSLLILVFTALLINSCTTTPRIIKTVSREDSENVTRLIERGADVNARDEDGYTALMYASGARYRTKSYNYRNAVNPEIVQMLIEAGTDVNAQDKWGNTALMYASGDGHTAIVKLLIETGAYINVHDQRQYTALMAASKGGHTEVVKLLFEAGAEVNKNDISEQTALTYAVGNGQTEIVKLLIEAGADVNVTSTYVFWNATSNIKRGDAPSVYTLTVLILAVEHGHTEIVKLLIDAGADVNALGGQAILYAAVHGYKDIIKLLREAGAK